jgi:hypothetical protein
MIDEIGADEARAARNQQFHKPSLQTYYTIPPWKKKEKS